VTILSDFLEIAFHLQTNGQMERVKDVLNQ
jgi:hypothetical protein